MSSPVQSCFHFSFFMQTEHANLRLPWALVIDNNSEMLCDFLELVRFSGPDLVKFLQQGIWQASTIIAICGPRHETV